VTATRQEKRLTLKALIERETAPHATLVRWGLKHHVEDLIRKGYRLGYSKGKAARRG
jgi:hypothetical protein